MMRRFWQQHREDEIERLLRANRAEPREEFVASLLQRLETQQRRVRPQHLGRRIAVAAAVTAIAAGAGIAAGGVHAARTSISGLVHVAQSGVSGANHPSNNNGNAHQDKNGSSGKDDNGNGDDSAGDHQYAVEVCHHTGSTTNPWVPLFLSPQGAANHVKHHPPDYIVGAPGNPTTCPP
jgi:hypothetical protein